MIIFKVMDIGIFFGGVKVVDGVSFFVSLG